MKNLFKGNIYPNNENSKFLDYFKEYFDYVFVAFNPFFKMINSNDHKDEYPKDIEITKFGKIVRWQEIKKECNFKTYNEVIYGLRKYSRDIPNKDYFYKVLTDYCNRNEIYEASDGSFCILTQKEIKRIFVLNNYKEIIIQDEFGDESEKIKTEELEKGLESIVGVTNIYSKDKKILFTIDWDSYYFLFCSSKDIIEKSLKNSCLEGFFSTNEIGHLWEFNSEIAQFFV